MRIPSFPETNNCGITIVKGVGSGYFDYLFDLFVRDEMVTSKFHLCQSRVESSRARTSHNRIRSVGSHRTLYTLLEIEERNGISS